MSSPTDTSVLVTGLPDTIDVDSVKIHFSASFHVDHVFLLEAGEAFVVFNSTSAAETAVTDMDQSTLCGNTIQVKLVPGSRRSDLDQKVSMLLSRVCPTPMSSLDFAALLKALSSLSADEKRQVVAVLNPPVAGVNNDSSGAASTPVSSTGHAASGSAASAKTASTNAASSTTASSGTTTAPPSGSIPGPTCPLPPASQPGQMNAASGPLGYTLPPPGFHHYYPPSPYYPAARHPGSHIFQINQMYALQQQVQQLQVQFEEIMMCIKFQSSSVFNSNKKSFRSDFNRNRTKDYVFKGKCYRCKDRGHKYYNCPNRLHLNDHISSLPLKSDYSNHSYKACASEFDATVRTVNDSDSTKELFKHVPRTGYSVPLVSSNHEGYQDSVPDVEDGYQHVFTDNIPEDDIDDKTDVTEDTGVECSFEDTDATIEYDMDEFFQLDNEVQDEEGLEERREDVEDSKEEKKEEDEEKKEEDEEKKEDDEQKKEDKEIIEDTDEVEETPDAVPDENRRRQRRISDPCPLRRSTRDRRPPSRYDPTVSSMLDPSRYDSTVSSLLLYIQHLHNTMYRNQLSLP